MSDEVISRVFAVPTMTVLQSWLVSEWQRSMEEPDALEVSEQTMTALVAEASQLLRFSTENVRTAFTPSNGGQVLAITYLMNPASGTSLPIFTAEDIGERLVRWIYQRPGVQRRRVTSWEVVTTERTHDL